MPSDANAILQAQVTKTASFQGAGFDLKSATPRRGLWVRFIYSAAANATGANAFTFGVDESSDNSTWFAKATDAADAVNLTTTAQSGEVFLLIQTDKRYIRPTVTLSGAGTVPTITYHAEIVAAKP